jgi:glycosyltransferase involved in cell wall biosynthesis
MPQSNRDWKPSSIGIALAAYQPNPVWLAEQLASIATQTHTEWICMITLDSPLKEISSSSDLSPFMRDERFIWVENPERLGLRSNFQKATQLLLGRGVDLIAFCDQDDIWLPEKLAESVAAIRARGPLSMVYCDAFILVDGVKRLERLHEYTIKTDGNMSIAERIIQPQVSGFCEVFDASLAKLHPTIPLECAHHDFWYSLVAAAYGGVHRIDKPLALYRQHAGNTIGISAVRAQQGWGKTERLKRYSTLRENAHLRASVARQVGLELPMMKGLAFLYQHFAGWFLVLIVVMMRRLFSDQFLAANAYRKAWGLLLLAGSQREFVQQVRQRLPAKIKVVQMVLAVGMVLLVGCALIATQLFAVSGATTATVVFACLFAVSKAITGLRYLQHQMPYTPVLIVGIAALIGLFALLGGAGVWLAVATAAVPIIANGLYRLRWTLRP